MNIHNIFKFTVFLGLLGSASLAGAVTANNDLNILVDEDGPSVTYNITANDGGLAPFTVTKAAGQTPPFVKFQLPSKALLSVNANGDILYDPNGAFEDRDAGGPTALDGFTYEVEDLFIGSDTATVTFRIIGADDAPLALNIGDQVNDDGDTPALPANTVPNAFKIIDSSNGDTIGDYSIVGGSLPNGLFLNPATGQITGTIAANGSNTVSNPIRIVAKDSDGNTSSPVSFVWTVKNWRPVAKDDVRSIVEETISASGNVLVDGTPDTDGGLDSDTLSVIAISGGGLVGGAASTGTYGTLSIASNGAYTYTLNNAHASVQALDPGGATITDTFTYTLSDGTDTDTADLVVTISGADDGPTTTNIGDETNNDGETPAVNFSGDFAPGGDTGDTIVAYAVTAGSLPTGLSLTGATGAVTGTLAANASAGSPYNITIRATDSDGDSVSSAFTWTVNNVAPVANDDAESIVEETVSESGNVLVDGLADTDGGLDSDTLSVIAVTGGGIVGGAASTGTYGTLSIASNGTYTYTLNNAHASVQALDPGGATITDTFTYTLSDGTDTDTADLVVTISGADDGPTTTNIGDETNNDGETPAVNFSGDFAPGGDTGDTIVAYAVTAGSLPTGLSLTGATGAVTGTLAANASVGSPYNITIRATDSDGDSVSSAFTWTVNNVAPVANDDAESIVEETVSESGNVLVDGLADTDGGLDSDTLSVIAISGGGLVGGAASTGTYGTLSIASNGAYTYTLNNAHASVQALDPGGATITDTFTYTLSDGTDTDTADLVVTISGADDGPTTTNIGDETNNDGETPAVNFSGDFAPGGDTGDTIVAYAVTAGSLPTGLSLTGATGAVTGTLAANASAGSPYNITIQATDSDGDSVSSAFTWTVNNVAPVANDDAESIVEETVSESGNVLVDGLADTDGGLDSDTLSVIAISGGGLVGGAASTGTYGTLSIASNGAYTYTLNNAHASVQALDPGGATITDTFTYTLSDGTDTDTADLVVTISGADDGPTTTNIGDETNNDGETPAVNFSGDFAPGGDTGDTIVAYAVTAGSLPTGLSLTGATGAVTGTLAANASAGSPYNITIRATDSDGDSVSSAFTWTVNNIAPTTTANTAGINEDGTSVGGNVISDDDGSGTDTDTAPDTDAVSVSAISNVASGAGLVDGATTLDGNYGGLVIGSTGAYTYTIDNSNPIVQALDDGATITDTFTYTLSDGTDTDTAGLVVTITGVNDNPVAVDDADTLTENGGARQVDVRGNDTDVDNSSSFTVTAVTQGANGSAVAITNAGTDVSFAPDLAFYQHLNVGDTDTETFTYTITDDQGGTDTATVTITVSGENDNPDAVDDTDTLTENGGAQQVDVLGNDTDDDDGSSFTVTDITQGTNGSAVAITNGGTDVSFTPDLAFYQHLNVGDTDTETFTYTITDDQGGTDTATVTITVSGSNDNPDAVDDTDTLTENGGAQQVDVLGNDTDDDDGSAFTVTSITQGTNGSVVAITNGGADVSFAPDPAFYQHLNVGDTDTETFTYTITDDQGGTDTATVTITVSGSNDNPDAVDDTDTLTENGGAQQVDVLANDTDEDDGSDFTITSVTQGANGSVVAITNGGTDVSFAPDLAFHQHLNVGDTDTETFTYTITDDQGGTDTATVTITVSGENDNPDAVDDTDTLTENGGAQQVDVLGNDTDDDDGSSFTVTDITQGTNGSVVAITNGGADVSFAPDPAFYQHLNVGDTDTETFTYTITDDQGGTDTATVTITVSGSNDNPVAVDDTDTLTENGGAQQVDVLGNDTDDDDGFTFTVTSVTQGSNGSVVAITNGGADVSFAPDPAFYQHLNVGDTDTETFTYTVTDDQGGTDTATVTITVSGENDNPDAVDDADSLSEDGGTQTIDVLANDTDDDDASTFVVTSVTQGANGSAVAITNAGADVSFTPDAAFHQHLNAGDSDTETFTYTITDDQGGTDTATVTITINGDNDAPVITSNGGATLDVNFDEDSTATITTVLADDDDDGDGSSGVALLYSIDLTGGADGAQFSIDPSTGELSFLLARDYESQQDANSDNVYEVTVRATDDSADFDDQLIRVALQNVNEAANAAPLSFVVGYMEDAGTVDLTDIVVTDGDDGLTGQTITVNLTLNDSNAGALTTSGSASYDSGSGLWTITDTLANVNAALASVAFVTGADHDTDTTITTHVEDQDGQGPADGTIVLDVTAVNDAPDATNLTKTVAWIEDQATVDIDNIVVTDVDDADYPQTITATLTLSDKAAGTLSTPGSSTYTAGTGVWTITDDLASVNAALASVQFIPALNYDLDFTITTQIDDSAAGPGGAITLDVTAVNDAPIATNTTQTITYDEDTDGVDALVPNIVISDVDHANYPQTITVKFTLADYLPISFNDAGFNALTGVWTMTDTLENVNATLASLTFDSTTDWDEDSSFEVVILDQGLLGPAASTITLDVVPTNDRPVVNDQAFSIDENAPNGTVVGTVVAYDEESAGCTFPTDPGCQKITFSITGSAFNIDDDGVITVAGTSELDREALEEFTPVVTVTDNGTPVKDDDAVITISLNPLNDNMPVGVDDAVSVDELDTLIFNVLTEGTDLDADLPAEELTVSEVAGDPLKVGVAQDLITEGVIVGSLTIEADGTATFVANPDNTVEKFEATQTYTLSDGDFEDPDVEVTITVNPQNDNQPVLTSDGTDFATAGVEYDEGAHTVSNKLIIPLVDYFQDLDIDEDGMLDSSTSGDNDGLVFSVTGNTNAILITTELNGTDLAIYSPGNEHGTADITVTATDTADPAGNITSVDLDFTVTVNSVNDAPTYVPSTYSSMTVDEDSPNISIPLAAAFSDADIDADSDSTDDSLTFTITVVDVPSIDAIETVYVDLPFTVISDDEDTPSAGARTTVYETTDPGMVIQLAPDGHGYLDITVRATDEGRPPELPADPVFLFDEESFRITVQGLGDDTPVAEDDHYNDFPELVVEEDGGPITFNVLSNDYLGDVPSFVISAGQSITDTSGAEHTWRTTSRLADRNNTGDFVIEINGEVTCAHAGCQDDETVDTSIIGAGILDNSIMYKPGLDFNGEDSFVYCIQDTFPATEPAFTPPSDVRCATVTVNVTPVNDLPRVPAAIIYEMDQADDLIVPVEEGLATKVTGVDNTHIDGLGCDPQDSSCTPPLGRDPDPLYFFFNSAVTTYGQLIPPFETDGSFSYRPSATFAGSDSFLFDVCETPTPSVESCVFDVLVTIIVEAIEGAPEGLSDDVVEVDFDLADIPLELPVGPEANVLIVNDDSGSMDWDILTDQDSGIFYFDSGQSLNYVMKATAGSSSSVAPSEEAAPNQGLWRLRNSDYNKVYYNPDIRYDPWNGLRGNSAFPDSDPTAALHNPLVTSGYNISTNLRVPQDYTGRAVVTTPVTCTTECRWYRRGRCQSYQTVCSGGTSFQYVDTEDLYLPRYYIWDNKDATETTPDIDAVPSPILDPDNSDGILVEIRPASEGGSDTYPKPVGRTDCVTLEGFCTYEEELQNFANWFTYSRNREFTAKSALGKVVAASENIRVGYAKLNDRRNGQPIESMNNSERTGAKADLLNTIYQTESSGGTPLRQSLRDAGRHFACRDNDIFRSNSNSSPGDAGCPIFEAPAGNCQQNFALLISDGAWNGGNPNVGDEDDDGDTNFDKGRYAGSYNETLADVAMEYYEFDLHPSLLNEVPTSSRDIEGAAIDAFENNSNVLMHQHMKTFTVGFGVDGLIEDDDVPTDYTQSFNWGSPTNTERKIDDMRHAAVNGRGQYLSAGNAATLATALVSAFEEFQQGSGAASAVSFNSQEILEDTLVFRSFYNTKNNTGDLIAQAIELDGTVTDEPVWNAAARLDEIDHDDRVILTYDRYLPVSPETNATYAKGIPFRPANLNVEQREAFSLEPAGAQQDLEVNQRVGYLRGDDANERPTGNFRERPGVEGRLGDIVHSAPTFIGIPSRLGRDTAPFPQDDLYSDFRAANELRDPVVYVAANDGMLHGFNAETGDEVIAYMPDNLMTSTYSRDITELLNFEYSHKYFVDSTPAVNDVYIDIDQDGDKEWRTILISGQGGGGKAYFALDITDPTKFTDATADQVVLWEFTDDDDTYPTDEFGDPLLTDSDLDGSVDDQRQDLLSPARPVKDLGYTFSVPTIVMSNIIDPDGEHKWVSITGNGYNSTAGIAKLLVLFLDGGLDGKWCHPDINHNVVPDGPYPDDCEEDDTQDFVKLDTGFGVESGLPNGLGEPRAIDTDGNGTADYVYAGDLQGNFFRFDITDPDFNLWTVTKIFKAQYKPGTLDEKNQPITTQPIAIIHPTEEEGFIIIFGTGAYLRTGDSTDPSIQSIYGVWDRLGPELIDKSELQEQSYTNFSDPLGLVRTLSDSDVDYSVSGGQKGWFIDLDAPPPGGADGDDAEFPGEKAVRNIQLRGGLAFVNSIFPRETGSCVGRAGGATLSFCPDTGGSLCFGGRTVFDLNNDGAFDSGDDVNTDQTAAGIILQDPSPPTDSTFIGDKRVTQYGRELHIIGTNTSSGNNTGRLSWKRLEIVN